jgi:hypothetical protein
MKTNLNLLCFLLISISVVSQGSFNFPFNEFGRVEYRDVVELDSMSKEQLFTNAKQWITRTYGDYKKVLQNEDKENGVINIKAKIDGGFSETQFMSLLLYNGWQVEYILTIECKDNRYRYTFSDFVAILVMREDISATPFENKINSYEKEKVKYETEKSLVINQIDSLINVLEFANKRSRKKIEDELNRKKNILRLVESSISNKGSSHHYLTITDESISMLIESMKNRMNRVDDF